MAEWGREQTLGSSEAWHSAAVWWVVYSACEAAYVGVRGRRCAVIAAVAFYAAVAVLGVPGFWALQVSRARKAPRAKVVSHSRAV